LFASGRIAFSDAIALIQFRSQAMNDACEITQGGMAVVLGLNAEAADKIVSDLRMPQDLWVANYNCPGQVVISGTQKGIQTGTTAALAHGAKRVLPLQVHGAFHSGLMRSAEKRMADYIPQIKLTDSSVDLVMNVAGCTVREVQQIRTNLIKQVTGSVRWEQSVRHMESAGTTLFIEMGCGKTLAGFNKRIAENATTINIEHIKDLDLLVGAL
jgi:[acyl-carrier-protein] S-malonyltransferase